MAHTEGNLAAVLHGIDDIRLENIPMPVIGDNDVLLRMACVGICGSDIQYWKRGRTGRSIVKAPMVCGHESAGVVEECGSSVNHLKKGDRVAIEPGIPCWKCDFCKTGRYNLCRHVIFCATPPVHGNLCKFYKHPANLCFKLPNHVSLEEGAVLEPLSVAVHACRRAGVRLGSSVLICGAGPIGIVSLLTAKAMGATNICITDVVESRLELATKLGADHSINVKVGNSELISQEVEKVMKCKPDITIECSGVESSVNLGIYATKSGGTLVLVGMGPPEIKIPITNAACREVDIRGIFRYANCYPLALEMVASGKVDVKPLITHRFKMEDTVKAFETSFRGADGVIKVMISC